MKINDIWVRIYNYISLRTNKGFVASVSSTFNPQGLIELFSCHRSHNKFVTLSTNDLLEIKSALGFYADSKKYFSREGVVDMNQTTAIFKESYRKQTDLTKPNLKTFLERDVRAILRIDQGKIAQKALDRLDSICSYLNWKGDIK